MAARQCPQCERRIPAGWVAAYTDGFNCPGCETRLEVSAGTRYLAVTAGLAFGAVAAWLTAPAASNSFPGWVMPLLASFLVFSIGSPLVTMLTGDLVVKKEPGSVSAPAESVHGQSGQH